MEQLRSVAYTLVLCMRPRGGGKPLDSTTPDALDNEPWPLDSAGFLSRVYFVWASPLIEVGVRRPLQLSDMWQLGVREKSKLAGEELGLLWEAELARHGPEGASFGRVAWRRVQWDIALTFAFKMGWLVFAMLGNATLLSRLIRFFESDEPEWHGYLYALGFLACEALRSAFVNQHWLIAVHAGVRLRAGVRSLVFAKLTRLRGTGLPASTAVNLLLSDAGRLLEACNYVEFLFSTPVTILVSLVVMITVIGPSAVAGFVILFLFSPLQARIGAWLASLRRQTVKITDERVRLVNELLSGIRLLKLYGYEGTFGAALADVRAREVAMLRKAAAVRVVNSVAAFALPVLVTLGVFATVTLTGGQLQPSSAFVVLSLFNVARFPLGVLPQATRQVSEAVVAARRIQAFLLLPEQTREDRPVQLSPSAVGLDEETREDIRKRTGGEGVPTDETAVWAAGLTCTWEGVGVPQGAPGGGKGKDAPTAPPANGTAPPPPPAVRSVSLSIARGTCVAVVGGVGSGKSSLLAALLGHMRRVGGAAAVRGTVAYCCQTAWITSGTVRENVLLGSPFEEVRYRAALRVCALEPDLATLPAGDATEIGERGVNLSGGQKARVALARAVYSDADVFVLDDPLAAVDAHTSAFLWSEAIQGALVRAGKTVLLVTHAANVLPHVDSVLVVADGAVTDVGTYADLIARGVDMRTLAKAAEGQGAGGEGSAQLHNVVQAGEEAGVKAAVPRVASFTPLPLPSPTSPPPSSLARVPLLAATMRPVAKAGGMAVEDRATGAVAGNTFVAYLQAAGGLYTGVLIFLVLIMGKGSRQVSDWFLSLWTTVAAREEAAGTPLDAAGRNTFLWQYTVTVAGVILCTLLQGLLFSVVTLRASRRLHDAVATAILRAKITWFDTQPLGRILNRFTGDIDAVDTALPSTLETCLDFLTQCALAVVLLAAVLPWFLIALVPLLITFVFITQVFRRVARELKRLDNMARGPLVTAVGTTAGGLATLRCYGVLGRYTEEYAEQVDINTRTYWCLYVANRWVAVRVDWVTSLTAGVTGLLAVTSREWLTPALAGLAMSSALSLAGVLQYCMRLTTETEAYFTSVERLTHYSSGAVPFEEDIGGGQEELGEEEARSAMEVMEAEYGPPTDTRAPLVTVHAGTPGGRSSPSPSSSTATASAAYYPGWRVGGPHWNAVLQERGWPAWGALDFQSVSVRYREGLPLVIRDVSFKVAPGTFVGIVGRTGSGKSTLALTLLRALEPEATPHSDGGHTRGRILMDGVDIARVSVYQLRRGVAIIPQDPTLFNGTVATNLDMFCQHSEGALWEALDAAGLKEWAGGLAGGLHAPITEGGGNLSVGQRQLVCLARALLRRARLVVLDEATASLDRATDAAIQTALRTSARASGATVLVVAHRLNTVLDCDRVLSLHDGRVVEFDAPAALLGLAPALEGGGASHTGDGLLSRLVEDTGEASAVALKAQALAAYAGTARKEQRGARQTGARE